MSDLPRATVVVPVRNAARTIEECVQSLLGQTYPRELLELVVVDNGSRDGTREILDRYAGEIGIVDEPRPGRSAARNAGIRRAGGDVVAFTDADCTADPDWVRELVPPLSDPSVGIVGGAIRARPGANDAELYGETVHDQQAAIEIWRPPYVITMSWASRRSVLEAAGRFDESLRRVEDGDLSYRIVAAGYRLEYRPAAVVYHRNERTLLGLAREGWQHGFHAVPVLARHAGLVAAARALPPRDPPPPRHPLPARYERAFRTGKRLGRAMGEIVFR